MNKWEIDEWMNKGMSDEWKTVNVTVSKVWYMISTHLTIVSNGPVKKQGIIFNIHQ